MKAIKLITAASIAIAIGAVSSANAGVLYTQPSNANSGYASQNDTNVGGIGSFATSYDNFTLGSPSTVTDVSWDGSYTLGSPGITKFTLQFYGDNAGQPGTSLVTETIPGTANETSLGTDNLGDPYYSYSATLPASFAAAAGTQYWLSIVPDIGEPPQWFWETGTGGDGNMYQDFFGTLTAHPTDLAFTLSDNSSIPEPASLCMLGLGAASLLLRRRNNKAVA